MNEAGVETPPAFEDSFMTHLFGFFESLSRRVIVNEVERAVFGVVGSGSRARDDPVVFGGPVGRGDEEHLATKSGAEFIGHLEGFGHFFPEFFGREAIVDAAMSVAVNAEEFKRCNVGEIERVDKVGVLFFVGLGVTKMSGRSGLQ